MSMQAASLEVLEKANLPAPQARAIVQAIEIEIAGAQNTLATKQDIAQLRPDTRQDIAALRQDTKEDIAALRREMKDEFGAVRQAINVQCHALSFTISH